MVLLIGEQYRCKNMVQHAQPMIKKYLNESSNTPEFDWLSISHLSELIGDNESAMEIDLLVAILRWAKSKINDHPIDIEKLIDLIRPEMITLDDFNSHPTVKQHSILLRSLRKRIDFYNKNIFAQPLLQSNLTQIRCPSLHYCQIDGVQCQTPIRIRKCKKTANAM